MFCNKKNLTTKKISKFIICLTCLISLSLFLFVCQPREEMALYYNGIYKTAGENHSQHYEYAMIRIPYTPYASKDIILYPEDFYLEINGKKIIGQSFIEESAEKIILISKNIYWLTNIQFIHSKKIDKDKGGSICIYFDCSLENVDKIFYKNNKLPLYSEYTIL